MIAHPGERPRRRRFRIAAYAVHQSRSRPPCRDVEAGFVGFGPTLAITGERCIDQPLVKRREILITKTELLAHTGGEVGNKDIGCADETVHDVSRRRLGEIKGEPPLVTRGEHPCVILVALRAGRQLRYRAVRIACARWLDLDYVGSEV